LYRNKKMPSKRYNQAFEARNGGEAISLTDAIAALAKFPRAKFDESVDLAMRLGVDPKHSDQMVRGTVALPNGSGKTVRVAAFAADGPAADAAKEAGADHVGLKELMEKVEGGWTDFDVAVATPEAMKAGVAKLGRQLGPRGLMPTPKAGTVSDDLGKVIGEVKAGRVEFKVDKSANLQMQIGKVSFDTEKLIENAKAAIIAVIKAKPDSTKGTYLMSASLSATMSPSVKLDVKEISKLG
jgi:large subunit ribosomal protein L1